MRLILNVIWLVLAGFWMALGYALAAVIMFILIITIPFGVAALRIGVFALWPFGKTVVARRRRGRLGHRQRHLVRVRRLVADPAHLITGVALCLTIIGIPLGLANFKLIPGNPHPLRARHRHDRGSGTAWARPTGRRAHASLAQRMPRSPSAAWRQRPGPPRRGASRLSRGWTSSSPRAGIERTGEVEQPRLRPWATLLTAPTDHGPVWLKAASPHTAFEVPLYELLARAVPDRVLTPIGADPERGWILLPDGGPSLGERLSGADVVEGWSRRSCSYGRLQASWSRTWPSSWPGPGRHAPGRDAARFDEALEARE